jgi:hypothetical protein
MLSPPLSSMRAWSQARKRVFVSTLRPARTRSEAEKQRQRWESSSLTRIIPGTKLFSVCMLPLKRDGGVAHAPPKNLYMALNCRKVPFILECRYHYSSESSCFTFLQLSAFESPLFGVLRSSIFSSAKGGIRNPCCRNRRTSLKQTLPGGGFRRTATSPRGVPGFKPCSCVFPSPTHAF